MESTELSNSINLKDEKTCTKLLPNPFQDVTPVQNTILNSNATQHNPLNHFHGYRSHFNINEQKESYQRSKAHQNPHFHQNQRPPCSQNTHSVNRFQQKRNQNFRYSNNTRRSDDFFKGQHVDGQQQNEGGYCELCERAFHNQRQLQKHLSEHEKCCYDGCNFEGHSSLLKKHIEAQHNSGLFQAIGKVETDEDIDKWREERRKRYPTKANIEARQLAQEERLKRGERLKEPNNRFGKSNDRRSAKNQPSKCMSNRDAVNKPQGKKKRVRKQRNHRNHANKDEKAKSVEEDANKCVTKFSGIGKLNEEQIPEESKKEKSKENALTALLGIYGCGSDSESENEDNLNVEHEDNQTKDDADNADNEVNVTDGKMEDMVHTENRIEEENQTKIEKIVDAAVAKPVQSTRIDKIEETFINQQSSDDEPPDEHPIQHINDDFKEHMNNESQNEITNQGNTTHKRAADTAFNGAPASKLLKKKTVFDMTRKIRRQNSLLEKLLQKDIRHERNVLLQCVRHVVSNNFFVVGQSTDDKTDEK